MYQLYRLPPSGILASGDVQPLLDSEAWMTISFITYSANIIVIIVKAILSGKYRPHIELYDRQNMAGRYIGIAAWFWRLFHDASLPLDALHDWCIEMRYSHEASYSYRHRAFHDSAKYAILVKAGACCTRMRVEISLRFPRVRYDMIFMALR